MHRRRIFSLILGFAVVVAACRDVSSPAPEQSAGLRNAPQAGLLGSLVEAVEEELDDGDTVVVLQRKERLEEPVTVKKTIDASGGTIVVPGTGLTVHVPQGAVLSPTEFTVTALAGRAVAYEFGPHGMEFALPLQFVQDLSDFEVADNLQHVTLNGGYFEDTTKLLDDLLRAVVEEVLPATVDGEAMVVRFDMKHFSGYLVAVEYQE